MDKKTDKTTDVKWLNAAVAKGLAGLLVLRLPNSPPEEVIVQTAQIWVLAITKTKLYNGWNEKEDKWRIEQAFIQLYAECEFFPSPKMLIDRLPKRKQPEVLIEQKITAEDKQRIAENCQKLRELLKGSVKNSKINPHS